MNASVEVEQLGQLNLSFTMPDSMEEDMIVERAILRVDSTLGTHPMNAEIRPPGGEMTEVDLNKIEADDNNKTWTTTDKFIGRDVEAGQQWQVELRGLLNVEDDITKGQMIVHGYPEDGLVDRLMQYRNELQPAAEANADNSGLKNEFERVAKGDTLKEQTQPTAPLPKSQLEPDAPVAG